MRGIQNAFRLFLVLLGIYALFTGKARSATFITATVTVTNAPTVNGNALTVNGNARTFTNAPAANPAIYISTNAAIGGSATNLFKQLAAYPFSGTMTVSRSGTNGIILRSGADEALAASISSGWATLVLVTNTSATTYEVRTPLLNTAAATNLASLLVKDIGEKSTNSIGATSTALANYVSLSQAQTITGAKTYSGANVYSNASQIFALGKVDGAYLTNVPRSDVTSAYIGSGYLGTLSISNGFGAAIAFADTAGAADAKKAIVIQTGGQWKLVFTSDDGATQNDVLTIGRTGATPNGASFSTAITGTQFRDGTLTNATVTNCIAGFTSGTVAGVTVTNSTLYGTVGKLSAGYWDGGGATNLTTTNTTFTATNTFTGALTFPRSNHTSLANGNNAGVVFGTKHFIKIKAGPTAAFTIAGIAGGVDGEWYLIYNSTGQAMTIANDSGVDPTAANRIFTNTGADVTTTGNGAVEVYYDSEDARWIVTNVQL